MVNPFDAAISQLSSVIKGLQLSLTQGVQGTFRTDIQSQLTQTQTELALLQGQSELFESQITIQEEQVIIPSTITNNLSPIIIIGAIIIGASLLFSKGKK